MIVEREILKRRSLRKNLLTQGGFYEVNKCLILSLEAYCFLVFLLKPSSGRLRFCLVLQGQTIGSQAIIGQVIGGRVIVDLLAQRVKVCQFSNNWGTLAHYIYDRRVEPSKNN